MMVIAKFTVLDRLVLHEFILFFLTDLLIWHPSHAQTLNFISFISYTYEKVPFSYSTSTESHQSKITENLSIWLKDEINSCLPLSFHYSSACKDSV